MDLQPAGPAGPVRAAQQYGHGPGPPLSALLVCPWWLLLHLYWCCVRAEPHPLLPVPCLGVPPGRVSLHALPPAIAADYAFSEGRRLVARCQDGDATALLEIVEVSCALTPCGWRRLSRPTLAPRTTHADTGTSTNSCHSGGGVPELYPPSHGALDNRCHQSMVWDKVLERRPPLHAVVAPW